MTDKERELVQQLLEKTRAKTIPWEATADENEFVAPFKGQATFTISRDPSEVFRLVMRNVENREMLEVDSLSGLANDAQQLATLYRAAHDSALNVEETLDAILKDLRKVS